MRSSEKAGSTTNERWTRVKHFFCPQGIKYYLNSDTFNIYAMDVFLVQIAVNGMSEIKEKYSIKIHKSPLLTVAQENRLFHDYFDASPIKTKQVSNGIILPAKKFVDDDGVPYYRGGVIDAGGRFVSLSQHLREKKSGSLTDAYPLNGRDIKYIDEEVIYAGILNDHIGHFLMESTSRLWYFIKNSYKPQKLAFLTAKHRKIIPQAWEFLSLLGIKKEDIYLISSPTRFKCVHVPSQSHIINTSYQDGFLVPFQEAAQHITPQNYDKIYLSRTKFKGGTPCLGEEHFEKMFKDNGYKVIYPEYLSLKEQISYIRGAKEIAGVIGTATHLEVFANYGIKSVIIERTDTPIQEQTVVHQALHAKAHSIFANISPFPIDHSAGPCLLGLNDGVAAYANEYGLKLNGKKINYISSKDCRKFIKKYLRTYTNPTYNRYLVLDNPLFAQRILLMKNAFCPLKETIKAFLKKYKK